jgi:ATP/maltotriose-dependent transcriptional regulator MalT
MIKMVGNELILPAAALLTLLRSRVTESDIRPMTSEILDLVDWLEEQGEDLERIRYHILVKDFELAAELFERQAETWLNQQVDVLSILFWLKEIPSVLLTSRATLCWLVAMCARRLGLALQVKTYLDLAENNLMTFTRFSCSQEQWRTIEINEQGVTVGELLQKIESLRKE